MKKPLIILSIIAGLIWIVIFSIEGNIETVIANIITYSIVITILYIIFKKPLKAFKNWTNYWSSRE